MAANQYSTNWGKGHLNEEDNKVHMINHQPKNYLNHSMRAMLSPALDATIQISQTFIENFKSDQLTDEYVDHAWKFICGQKARNDFVNVSPNLEIDAYKEKLFEIMEMKKTDENKKFVCSSIQTLLDQIDEVMEKDHPEYEKYHNRYENLLTKFQ